MRLDLQPIVVGQTNPELLLLIRQVGNRDCVLKESAHLVFRLIAAQFEGIAMTLLELLERAAKILAARMAYRGQVSLEGAVPRDLVARTDWTPGQHMKESMQRTAAILQELVEDRVLRHALAVDGRIARDQLAERFETVDHRVTAVRTRDDRFQFQVDTANALAKDTDRSESILEVRRVYLERGDPDYAIGLFVAKDQKLLSRHVALERRPLHVMFDVGNRQSRARPVSQGSGLLCVGRCPHPPVGGPGGWRACGLSRQRMTRAIG
ncbi:MAG: hypothetical protein M5U08_21530 [Burkholderiales bacterium]|nr:hypothetical protein [Burkholderiales bacterium]